jgi:hypothetical protein
MTYRIVTAAKPSRKRPNKPAQAAHIDQRIVVARKPGKHVRRLCFRSDG